MDDGKRGLEENIANVEMLPIPIPISTERETAMKKMMMAALFAAMVAVAFALNAGKTGCGPL